MIGIIFGCVCLLGFIAVWRGRFRRGGCNGRHLGGPRFYAARGRFSRLYRVFEALDTSPGQEKAIRAAFSELGGALGELRPRLAQARHGLATALSNDAFDAAALEHELESQLGEVARSSGAVVSAMGKIHETLDTTQRRRLARLVESLPHRLSW